MVTRLAVTRKVAPNREVGSVRRHGRPEQLISEHAGSGDPDAEQRLRRLESDKSRRSASKGTAAVQRWKQSKDVIDTAAVIKLVSNRQLATYELEHRGRRAEQLS